MPQQVVVDHIPKATQTYVGSPSIAVLADGAILASHDLFGPASERCRTRVFASIDGGRTWRPRADVDGQFWSTLFVHRGALYLIGPAAEFGTVVIRRSDDAARTWTTPTDADHGLLLAGRFHTAPTPVVEHAGRLWRAMEDIEGPGAWPSHFRSMMLSAPADADLLRADAWTCSTAILGDSAWVGGAFRGWLEGNAVVLPEGGVGNLLRVDAKPVGDRAALARVSADGAVESFDPARDLVTMPGGSVKFTVRRDPVAHEYWALTNVVPRATATTNPGIVRNTLALVHSRNLRDWDQRWTIWHNDDQTLHGCQYVDWTFDGGDLVAVARTADNDDTGGAHDFHDANYLTFFRLPNFRTAGARQASSP